MDDFGGSMCDLGKFVYVGDGTNGLDYAFVKQQQEVEGN